MHKSTRTYTRLFSKSIILLFALTMISMQTKNLQTKTTVNFRIRYPKNVSAKSVQKISTLLDRSCVEYQKKLSTSFHGKADVMLLASSRQLKSETKVFD